MIKAFFLCMALLVRCANGASQEEKTPQVYVKHLVPPVKYPELARQAKLMGTFTVRVQIRGDGTVSSVNASTEDELLGSHPLLQAEAASLVKRWTFGCFNCAAGEDYEVSVRFVYRLDGEPTQFPVTDITMDLPNKVTVIATPGVCDHCTGPEKPQRKKKSIP